MYATISLFGSVARHLTPSQVSIACCPSRKCKTRLLHQHSKSRQSVLLFSLGKPMITSNTRVSLMTRSEEQVSTDIYMTVQALTGFSPFAPVPG